MEPQHEQLTEQEEKLTHTLDALQQRVNSFRTQKETLKAQYTAAKAGRLGKRERRWHLQVDRRLRGGPPTGPGQDRHHAGHARAPDELLESGVLEDVGGGPTTSRRSWTRCSSASDVDRELAA